jgi:small subunit ribosomal protein S15
VTEADLAVQNPRKKDVIPQFQRHAKDTGSSEVQIAVLTDRIRHLTDHLKRFPKDNTTRRGLLQLVGQRASLLRYLARAKPEAYESVVERLGIRS